MEECKIVKAKQGGFVIQETLTPEGYKVNGFLYAGNLKKCLKYLENEFSQPLRQAK